MIIVLQNFVFSVKPQHESAIGIHISPPFKDKAQGHGING